MRTVIHPAHKMTTEGVRKTLKDGCEEAWLSLPVIPMPKGLWELACDQHGIDKEWSIKEGQRWGADAFIGGCPVIFTKRIPTEGV